MVLTGKEYLMTGYGQERFFSHDRVVTEKGLFLMTR
jgi:hypothetical protein